jgi:glycosyltransferase involved in cell wall biosynthesis
MEPCFDWFVESLEKAVAESKIKWSSLRVIVVDSFRRNRPAFVTVPTNAIHVLPKATVWQGEGRLTKQDWWATANARNTALCLCETEWIAFLDDRSVIQPGWFQPILDAQKGEYIVAGSYEKRREMTFHGGFIQHSGIITGEDGRAKYQKDEGLPNPTPCGGDWLFGCNFALPLEWALEVNGVDETCDGLSMEDVIFGNHLKNAGKPIKFDSRMKIVEDRTPGKTGPTMVRRDKGVSPNDKSHALLKKLGDLKRAQHGFDIRKVRDQARKGFGFPKPWGPKVDWYDQEPLSEMMPG